VVDEIVQRLAGHVAGLAIEEELQDREHEAQAGAEADRGQQRPAERRRKLSLVAQESGRELPERVAHRKTAPGARSHDFRRCAQGRNRSRYSKKSGNDLATQPGSSIVTPGCARPTTAKLIATRWSS